MPNSQIILGFDVGTHKVGVAVGQTLTQKATVLPRLLVQKGLPKAADIDRLLAEWKPQAIVVGLPVSMDGQEQFTTGLARRFIAFLKTRTTLPIHPIDERLTTKTARSEIFEQGGYRHLEKAEIDGYAAKLMVESWFSENP